MSEKINEARVEAIRLLTELSKGSNEVKVTEGANEFPEVLFTDRPRYNGKTTAMLTHRLVFPTRSVGIEDEEDVEEVDWIELVEELKKIEKDRETL